MYCLFFFLSPSCRINHCNSHPRGSGGAAWSVGQHLLLPKEGMVNACLGFSSFPGSFCFSARVFHDFSYSFFSLTTQRCQWALFKGGWQKHIVEGEGETELERGQREECKKFLQEPVSQWAPFINSSQVEISWRQTVICVPSTNKGRHTIFNF